MEAATEDEAMKRRAMEAAKQAHLPPSLPPVPRVEAERMAIQQFDLHACAKKAPMTSPQNRVLTPQLWDVIEGGGALAECEALLTAHPELLDLPSEVCSLHSFSHTTLDGPPVL